MFVKDFILPPEGQNVKKNSCSVDSCFEFSLGLSDANLRMSLNVSWYHSVGDATYHSQGPDHPPTFASTWRWATLGLRQAVTWWQLRCIELLASEPGLKPLAQVLDGVFTVVLQLLFDIHKLLHNFNEFHISSRCRRLFGRVSGYNYISFEISWKCLKHPEITQWLSWTNSLQHPIRTPSHPDCPWIPCHDGENIFWRILHILQVPRTCFQSSGWMFGINLSVQSWQIWCHNQHWSKQHLPNL